MRATPRSNGQVLVLGAVTLLAMALMLALSFNLTQAIHEKMRLQTHSDAMAYSMAAVEARSFNYFAYTNRAEAAVLVSLSTVHAYMSSVSMIPSILRAGEYSFFMVAAVELGQCLSCCPYCCVAHCVDAVEAVVVAFDYADEADDAEDEVEGIESQFNFAVQGLTLMIDVIHGEQQIAALSVSNYLAGNGLGALKTASAPRVGNLAPGVAVLNVRNYACAMEGSPLDLLCVLGNSKSSREARSKVMSDVANAARPDFDTARIPGIPLQLWPEYWFTKYQDIQDEGFAVPTYFGGHSGVSEDGDDCDIESLKEGKSICGEDTGLMIVQWRDGAGLWPYSGDVWSDDDGGGHDPDDAHSGDHDKFHGVQNVDSPSCILQGNCFINFRSIDDTDDDHGQPSVYAHYGQQLRGENQKPWELNSSASVTLNDGQRGAGTLNLVPNREAHAVSKAKAYFHRFDGWQHPPNMFDPYWRAKLHHFKRVELLTVLGIAGDPDVGAAAAGPIEGELLGE